MRRYKYENFNKQRLSFCSSAVENMSFERDLCPHTARGGD
ncbi:hypothetical protein HBZS_115880 [Helicobacter bizzozeronii CCUG 35545]|nr:hypothetical protein HBZS_115880 [Helicobacter bizzozeronii CCUG 35545]